MFFSRVRLHWFVYFLFATISVGGVARSHGAKRKGTTHLELSLIGNTQMTVEGLDAALVGSFVKGDLFGLQISGLFNHSARSVTGLQLAGGANHTGGMLTGLQAGFVNYAGRLLGLGVGFCNLTDHLAGVQAGGFNVTRRAQGAQLGFFNEAKRLVGLQAGVINLAYHFFGVQFGFVNLQAEQDFSPRGVPRSRGGAGLQAGMYNLAVDSNTSQIGLFNWVQRRRSGALPGSRGVGKTRTSSWLQIGLFNISENDTCVQIGLVNVTNRARCASLGLFQFIREGMVSAVLWREPLAGTNFGFQFAGKHLYSILGAGNANPVYGCEGQSSAHFHLGGRVALSRRWSLEADLGWSTFSAFEKKRERRAPPPKGIPDLDRLSLRVMARFRLFEYFSLYAGVGPGWIWDAEGLARGGLVPVLLGGVAADLPGRLW